MRQTARAHGFITGELRNRNVCRTQGIEHLLQGGRRGGGYTQVQSSYERQCSSGLWWHNLLSHISLGDLYIFHRILPLWVILYRANTSVPVKSKLCVCVCVCVCIYELDYVDLLCSTGNYIQYFVTTYMGKRSEKEYIDKNPCHAQ